jgi:hypothetical protein
LGEGHHARLCVTGKKRLRQPLAISTALLPGWRNADRNRGAHARLAGGRKEAAGELPGEPIFGKIDAPSLRRVSLAALRALRPSMIEHTCK